MNQIIINEYETLDLDKIKTLKDGIKEISAYMTIIDSQKNAIKDILDSVVDETGLSKKVVNKMAKVYHKNEYAKIIEEEQEFQTLYEGVIVNE